jgi:hypothetical protein
MHSDVIRVAAAEREANLRRAAEHRRQRRALATSRAAVRRLSGGDSASPRVAAPGAPVAFDDDG